MRLFGVTNNSNEVIGGVVRKRTVDGWARVVREDAHLGYVIERRRLDSSYVGPSAWTDLNELMSYVIIASCYVSLTVNNKSYWIVIDVTRFLDAFTAPMMNEHMYTNIRFSFWYIKYVSWNLFSYFSTVKHVIINRTKELYSFQQVLGWWPGNGSRSFGRPRSDGATFFFPT